MGLGSGSLKIGLDRKFCELFLAGFCIAIILLDIKKYEVIFLVN